MDPSDFLWWLFVTIGAAIVLVLVWHTTDFEGPGRELSVREPLVLLPYGWFGTKVACNVFPSDPGGTVPANVVRQQFEACADAYELYIRAKQLGGADTGTELAP